MQRVKSEPGQAYFVGRRAELEFFYNRFVGAVQQKRREIVTLNGPAGVGKSRLLDELTQRLQGSGRPLRVYRVALAAADAPGALRQVLWSRFALEADDTPEANFDRIAHGLSALLGQERLNDALRFVATAAGVTVGSDGEPFEGMSRALITHPRFVARAEKTVCNLLRYDAVSTPHLWIFEDWDRAERPHDCEVLDALIDRLDSRMSCVLISTQSPLALAHKRVSHFNLEPLSLAESARLIEGLVEKVESLPESFVADTARQSAGNPRLAEELVRLFRSKDLLNVDETGEWRFRHEDYAPQTIPGDLRTTVAQRVEELSEHDRQLLIRVRRFGDVAWVGGLVSLSRALDDAPPPSETGDAVRRRVSEAVDVLIDEGQLVLVDDDLIRGARAVRLPNADWRESLPDVDEATQRLEHGVIAQWLASRVARDPVRVRRLIVRHWLGAERYRRAGEHLVPWLSQASGADLDEAMSAASQTLDALRPDDAPTKTVLLRSLAARALSTQRPDQAAELLDRLAHEVAVVDDSHGHASTLMMRGECELIAGRLNEAIAYLDRARMSWETLGSREGRADTLERKAAAVAYRGGADAIEDALRIFEQVLELRRELGQERELAATLVRLGEWRVHAGQLTKARAAIEEALDRAQSIAPLISARAHAAFAELSWEAGEPGQAESHWDKALYLAREGGDAVGVARVRLAKAEPLVAARRSAEAREEADAVASVARELGRRDLLARALALSSSAALAEGLEDTATQLANESLDVAKAIGRQMETARALIARAGVGANVLFVADDSEDSRGVATRDDFQTAVSLLDEMGERPLLIKALTAFGRFSVERGAEGVGRRHLARARELRRTLRSDAAEERAFHAAKTIRRTYHTTPVALDDLEQVLDGR